MKRALAMRPYLSPPHVDSARLETFVVLRDRLVECRRRITSYQTKLRVFNVMHQRLHMSSYQRTWLVEDVEKLIWRYVREVNLITYQNDKFMRDMGAIAYREGYNSQEVVSSDTVLKHWMQYCRRRHLYLHVDAIKDFSEFASTWRTSNGRHKRLFD